MLDLYRRYQGETRIWTSRLGTHGTEASSTTRDLHGVCDVVFVGDIGLIIRYHP